MDYTPVRYRILENVTRYFLLMGLARHALALGCGVPDGKTRATALTGDGRWPWSIPRCTVPDSTPNSLATFKMPCPAAVSRMACSSRSGRRLTEGSQPRLSTPLSHDLLRMHRERLMRHRPPPIDAF
jgi:hypothetical protein